MRRGKSFGSCTYCRREMNGPASRTRVARTSDHVMPKCAGGVRKVRCCWTCNQLKGDIHPSVWRWFTENHPGWWKLFSTNREVVQVCAERFGGRVRAASIASGGADGLRI